jgi:hypothetical protein
MVEWGREQSSEGIGVGSYTPEFLFLFSLFFEVKYYVDFQMLTLNVAMKIIIEFWTD